MADLDRESPSPDISRVYASPPPAKQKATGQQTDSRSAVAGQTHGDFTADAAAFLERSGYSLQGIGGVSQAIERQAATLVAWAREKGLILGEAYTASLRRQPFTTGEHQVFYRQEDNRAVKLTYPGTFGATPDPKGAQRAATPLFYLRRLQLMNRVFKADLRLEGVMFGKSMVIGLTGEQPRVATSQPWIRPANPEMPHPSNAEIAQFMGQLGFREVSRSYYGWQRDADSIIILDARPDNFIKSLEGVVPIDLVISDVPEQRSQVIFSLQ